MASGVVFHLTLAFWDFTDGRGILEGNYTDGRRLCTFNNMEDLEKKGKELQEVTRQWLTLVDK